MKAAKQTLVDSDSRPGRLQQRALRLFYPTPRTGLSLSLWDKDSGCPHIIIIFPKKYICACPSTRLELKQCERYLPNSRGKRFPLRPGSYFQASLFLALSMSQTHTSSNFQAIFCASIKEYEKKTKKDILTHPLMAQLQTCNTPTDILSVLRTQVQHFEKSMCGEEKLARWLNPTINVLYAFSSALGTGVGLVIVIPTVLLRSTL